jgi:hypothetical protein
MPQVIGNQEKWKEAIEGLELSRALAKHNCPETGFEEVGRISNGKSRCRK